MAPLKVLVTGAAGQLGQDVVLLLQHQGHQVMGCDRQEMDITDLDQCIRVIGEFGPDAVIHCAAHTAVDAAESDIDAAYLINATGSRNVALASEKLELSWCTLVRITYLMVWEYSLTMSMIIQILRVYMVNRNVRVKC